MTLYLGDKEVGGVYTVPVPEMKYGATLSNLLGDIDEFGAYQIPDKTFSLDLSEITSIPAYGLMYKFQRTLVAGSMTIGAETISSHGLYGGFLACKELTSVSFPNLTNITGAAALEYCFQECDKLTSISFPALTNINKDYALNYLCYGCNKFENASFPELTSVSGTAAMQACFSGDFIKNIEFPKLTKIDGRSVMNGCFERNAALISISFPVLNTVKGDSAMRHCFTYDIRLPSISFPALQNILPLDVQNQFDGMFEGCTALTDIYFPAAMQERIEQLTGYESNFGAPNATIHFTL